MKRVVISLLALLCTLHAACAQSGDWQKVWDETLAQGRKEGKLVIFGSPDPVLRNQIIPKFKEKFGITIEPVIGETGPLLERARLERASGKSSIDVFMPGAGAALYQLEPENILAPIKPMLMLPEVTDPSKWKLGSPTFIDAGRQNVLMLFRNVESFFFINEDYVEVEEVRTADDLLRPKWKGKISMQDPLSAGMAIEMSSYFYVEKGPEFVRKLFVEQQPLKMADRRQLMDNLARGVYPICITCKIEYARDLIKEGFRIREVFELEGSKQRITTAPFVLAVAKDAPHPAAARIFVNWIATKEALEMYSRGNGTATLRTDADESFLNPEIIPKQGRDYFDATTSDWLLKVRPETMKQTKEVILKSDRP